MMRNRNRILAGLALVAVVAFFMHGDQVTKRRDLIHIQTSSLDQSAARGAVAQADEYVRQLSAFAAGGVQDLPLVRAAWGI
jgi:hypothetical protein